MRKLGTINVGAGKSENNHTATRPSLDLAGVTTHVDTVIESVQTDKVTKFALVGDAPGAITATVTGTGTEDDPFIVTMHYRTGVSTVANLQTAIGTMLTPRVADYVRVKTTGTAGNVLATPDDDLAETELTGGESFSLPASMAGQYVEIETAASDIHFGASVDSADPSAFSVDDTTGFELDAGFSKVHRIGHYGSPTVLAFYNAGGSPATVDVWLKS